MKQSRVLFILLVVILAIDATSLGKKGKRQKLMSFLGNIGKSRTAQSIAGTVALTAVAGVGMKLFKPRNTIQNPEVQPNADYNQNMMGQQYYDNGYQQQGGQPMMYTPQDNGYNQQGTPQMNGGYYYQAQGPYQMGNNMMYPPVNNFQQQQPSAAGSNQNMMWQSSDGYQQLHAGPPMYNSQGYVYNQAPQMIHSQEPRRGPPQMQQIENDSSPLSSYDYSQHNNNQQAFDENQENVK